MRDLPDRYASDKEPAGSAIWPQDSGETGEGSALNPWPRAPIERAWAFELLRYVRVMQAAAGEALGSSDANPLEERQVPTPDQLPTECLWV